MMYHSAVWLVLLATPIAAEDWRAVMRHTLARLKESDKQFRDYGFMQKRERSELHSNGSVKSTISALFKREMLDGSLVSVILERNGQPVAAGDREEAEEKIRQSRLGIPFGKEQRAGPTREDAWIEEFPDALDFKLIGEEVREGRKLWILSCEPRPAYKPRSIRAKAFGKMKGRIWIDQGAKDLYRVEAEMMDSVNIGFGVVGRIDKGTRLALQRTRLADGAWMTAKTDVRFAVRVMLFKYLYTNLLTETWDFKPRTVMARRIE